MRRFSLTGLSILTAGLILIATGGNARVLAGDSFIWIEPVIRCQGWTQEKRTAVAGKAERSAFAGDKKSSRSADAPESYAGQKSGGAKQTGNRGGMGHRRGRMRKAIVRAGLFPEGKKDVPDTDLAATQFWLELPDNRLTPIELKKKRGRYRVDYPTKTGGDYRLIGYNGNQVADRNRQHRYSYYAFMTHGDKPDKQPRDPIQHPGFHEDKPKLEIVRLYDSERDRYRSRAGHKLQVRVLYKGAPVPNAPLTLTTSKNWQKNLETDERGEAEFTLIKDDFQQSAFNKRKSTLYLLRTEHIADSPGELSGEAYDRERYVATLSFLVFPDSNEWESKQSAFLIAVFTIVVAAAAIIVHRMRRRNRA